MLSHHQRGHPAPVHEHAAGMTPHPQRALPNTPSLPRQDPLTLRITQRRDALHTLAVVVHRHLRITVPRGRQIHRHQPTIHQLTPTPAPRLRLTPSLRMTRSTHRTSTPLGVIRQRRQIIAMCGHDSHLFPSGDRKREPAPRTQPIRLPLGNQSTTNATTPSRHGTETQPQRSTTHAPNPTIPQRRSPTRGGVQITGRATGTDVAGAGAITGSSSVGSIPARDTRSGLGVVVEVLRSGHGS